MSDKQTEFKTLQKIEDMMEYAYPALAQFPKAEKFALATDIKHTMHNMLRYCTETEKKRTKKTTLQNLDIETQLLKYYIRLSYNLHFLPEKKYEVWSEKVVEIGRMVGGLLRAEEQKPDYHRE